MAEHPIEMITSGHSGPMMGEVVPGVIERLLAGIASGAAGVLQSTSGKPAQGWHGASGGRSWRFRNASS